MQTRTRTCGAQLWAPATRKIQIAARATRVVHDVERVGGVMHVTAGTGRAGRSLGRGWLGPEAVSASLVSSLESQHLNVNVRLSSLDTSAASVS